MMKLDPVSLRIIEAARVEFETAGYEGADLDAIAERARSSRSTVFRRFGNRRALFGVVTAYVVDEVARELDGMTRDRSAAETVTIGFVRAVRSFECSRVLRSAISVESNRQRLETDPRPRPCTVLDTAGRVAHVLRRRGATMPDDELREVAEIVVRVVRSYGEIAVDGGSRATEDELVTLAATYLSPLVH